jgi:hypothetical protein
MERTLGADWCAGWSANLPDYDAVPGQVNVQEVLRLWSFAKSLDLMQWG